MISIQFIIQYLWFNVCLSRDKSESTYSLALATRAAGRWSGSWGWGGGRGCRCCWGGGTVKKRRVPLLERPYPGNKNNLGTFNNKIFSIFFMNWNIVIKEILKNFLTSVLSIEFAPNQFCRLFLKCQSQYLIKKNHFEQVSTPLISQMSI